MTPETIDAIRTDPVAQKLIAAPIHARLAYNAKDGTPRVVPVGYSWDGPTLVTCSPPNAPKVPALQANPHVAITIDTSDFPPNILLVRGTAAIDIVEGVPDEFVASSRRFIGEAGMPDWEAGVRAMYREMAIISITPTWAKIIDFQTRLPDAVQELIDQAQ